jgi:magnesium transporter
LHRFIKKSSKTIGLLPGTIVHIGEKKVEKTRISIIDYDEEHFLEKEIGTAEECYPYINKDTVTWVNIDGIHQEEIIEKMGACCNLHPLLLEDIVNTNQRPKFEDFGDYIFIVLKMLSYNDKDHGLNIEQVSVIFGPHFVISFQESEGDVFNPVRERIRNGKGRIRKMGSDYLAYALIDAVVDNYFIILEKMGEDIESLEEELVKNPISRTLQQIHKLKRELIFVRKSVWPLREVINALERSESSLMQKTTLIYLRDVYDHTIQVIETVETFRDMASGMLDTYLSSLSNRMNEVMKVLTIIATIFIPLTFISGIYGMNFKYMPELQWHWGYYVIWGVMAVISLGMLLYFKKKKWI